MRIQRAYADFIEAALAPLPCDLTPAKQSGDLNVTCSKGSRQLRFNIVMSQDPQSFAVKVSYSKVEGNNAELGQVDPFQEQVNTLANWLKVSS